MSHIGIMGGTFNPIHLGHVHLAESAYRQFNLDKVIFIPAGIPPHKRGLPIADSKDRLNMVKIAVKEYPYFEVSDMEIVKNSFSYTYETLCQLKLENPLDTFYLILGADSLYKLESWYEPEGILKESVILVSNRDNIEYKEFVRQIEFLKEKYKADIRKIDSPMMDISSTMVRTGLKERNFIEGKLNTSYFDNNVMDYILTNKLYENIPE